MFFNIREFVINGVTYRRQSQKKLLNEDEGSDLSDGVKILLNKVKAIFSRPKYILQFSIGGREFYSEILYKNDKSDIVNLFNNRGNMSGLEFLKQIISQYNLYAFEIFEVSNGKIKKEKEVDTDDLISMIFGLLTPPAREGNNKTRLTSAFAWYGRQWRERPVTTALVTAAGVAVVSGIGYLACQAIKDDAPLPSSDSESETSSGSDSLLPPGQGVDPDDLTDISDLSSTDPDVSSDEGGGLDSSSSVSESKSRGESNVDTIELPILATETSSAADVATDDEEVFSASSSEFSSRPSQVVDSSGDEELDEYSTSSVSEAETDEGTTELPGLATKSSLTARVSIVALVQEARARLATETQPRRVGNARFFDHVLVAKTVAEQGGNEKEQRAVQNIMTRLGSR